MATAISRRKIAAYFADELIAGHDATKQLAAFLFENRRTREADVIVRDIEGALARRGILVADIDSSRALTTEAKKAIMTYLSSQTSARRVELRESIEPSLLGGVRIQAAGRELDVTLRHRLNQLKASKI